MTWKGWLVTLIVLAIGGGMYVVHVEMADVVAALESLHKDGLTKGKVPSDSEKIANFGLSNLAINALSIARVSRLNAYFNYLTCVVTCLLGIFSFLAFTRYKHDLKWRRTESLTKQIEELHKDLQVRATLRILEHRARKVRLPAHDEPTGFVDLPTSRAEIGRALRILPGGEQPNFEAFEYAVRDAFDRLLWHLHHYQRLVESGAIDREQLHEYLWWWYDHLTGTGEAKDFKDSLTDAILAYAKKYFPNAETLILTGVEWRKSNPKGRGTGKTDAAPPTSNS